MHIYLSYLAVGASDVDAYVEMWRSTVDPEMRKVRGYGGLALLRPRTDDAIVRLALLNWWADVEARGRWAEAEAELDLPQVSRLVRSCDSSAFEQDDELCLALENCLPAMCSIGFHQVLPGRSADYRAARLRVANPSMRRADGFVGISVASDPKRRDRFLTLFEWADDSKADEYYACAEHVNEVYPAIADVLTDLEPSERYDVLIRHTPR